MYEVELSFLQDNIDLIENNNFTELQNRAMPVADDNQVSRTSFWRNCIDILIDPDVNIDIFKGMTSIPDNYCYKDQTISNIILSPDVKVIGDHAFRSCSLTSIEMPGVSKIGWAAFLDCDQLQNIKFANGLQEIGGDAFKACTSLGKITLPNTCYLIEPSAFSRSSITSINIPAKVKELNYETFYECTNLQQIIFERNSQLQEIGIRAFYNCGSLKEITLPKSVNKIGMHAFYNCWSLIKIVIPNDNIVIDETALFNTTEEMVIYCHKGSKAELYARNYDINVEYI